MKSIRATHAPAPRRGRSIKAVSKDGRLRAAIYLRQSRSDDASVSLEAQERVCREYVERQGWETVEVFRDRDRSGRAGSKRPAFEELSGRFAEFDAVVSYRLDRLTRGGVVEFAKIMEALGDADAIYASATEAELVTNAASPFGRIIVLLVAAFAQLESDTISSRITDTRVTTRQDGRWTQGLAPFGFSLDEGVDDAGRPYRRLVEVPEEGDAIREAAAMLLAGSSLTDIATYLTSLGFTTRRGLDYFGRGSVRRLLGSPTLAGWVAHEGRPYIGEDGLPVRSGDAILDPDTWHRVQAVFAENAKRPRAKRDGAPFLGGLARCARCGFAMRKAGQTGPKGYSGYQCSSDNRPGACVPNTISAPRTDDLVCRVVREALPAYLDEGRRRQAQRAETTDRTGDRIASLHEAIAQLESRVARLVAEHASPQRVAIAEGEVSRLDAELRELQAVAAKRNGAGDRAAVVAMLGSGDPRDAFDALDADTRRALVHAVVASVDVAPREGSGRDWQPQRVNVKLRLAS